MVSGPKLYAFVLMPFSDEMDDIYQLGIKAACEEKGLFCERVDETHFTGPIYDKVVTSIAKADVITTDLTDRNPNVYYETGYAHALNKVAIHLCRDIDQIPFDLRGFQHIVYSAGIVQLKSDLIEKLEWAENYLQTRGVDIGSLSVTLYYRGKAVTESIGTSLNASYRGDGRIANLFATLNFDLYNSGASQSQELGPVYLYTPEHVVSANFGTLEAGASLPSPSENADFALRHRIEFKENLVVGEWKSLPITVRIAPDLKIEKEIRIPVRLRLLTESTPLDHDVVIALHSAQKKSLLRLTFAQEENPEEIQVAPQKEYRRDGSIDEAGFEIVTGLSNESNDMIKYGPLEIYTSRRVKRVGLDGHVYGIGRASRAPSDIEGFEIKFTVGGDDRISAREYKHDKVQCEIDPWTDPGASTDLIELYFRLYSDSGINETRFNVQLLEDN